MDALPIFAACRLILLALLIGLAGLAPAAAQETARQRLDAVRATLIEIDAAFKSPNLADADLLRLRAENDPLANEIQGVIAELAPRLEASSKRVVELTPKSKEAAPESAPATDAAAAELAAEQKRHDELDADLRTARALALQAEDNNARIGAARRELFARQTFERSSSLLSPLLWTSVAIEAPRSVATLGGLLRDWLHGVSMRLTRLQTLTLVALALAMAAAAPPLRWVTRRVIARDPAIAAPSALRRALVALWTILVLTCLPLSALWAIAYALDAFDISDPRLQGVQDAFFDGLRLMFVSNALARGVLAPAQKPWRLVEFSDRVAALLFRFWLTVAAIIAVEKLIEPAADAVASLNIAVAARAIAATLVAVSMAHTLRLIAGPASAAAQTPPARNSWGAARTLAWLLIALIVGAVLTGYIAFAAFITGQIIYVATLATGLYLLSVIVHEGAEATLQPNAAFGRGLMTVVGLRRDALEQISVLIQGLARVAIVVTAALLILGPWGIQSQDMFGNLRAAYFGFKVGDVTISISSMLTAVLVFMVGVLATRAVQGWLGKSYLPRTRLDAGLSNSIRTIFGYVGFVIAMILGSAQLGFDFQKLAIVAGALSVGIGFGLQTIVNNFVSGLILLWERGIRVGDWVVVGPDNGFVRRINARATEIETRDRATLIVPNSLLVSGPVKNWVHTDRVARIIIDVNVAYESDPEAMRELMLATAKGQELVLSIPAPLVLFHDFGDWALKFQLICFVDEIEMAEKVKSEMNFDLFRRMREANMRIPYPK